MPYELLSRSLAYISCLSTLSLALTSVAFAAVNVGRAKPNVACSSLYCQASYEPAPITGSLSAPYIASGRWSGACQTAKL